METEHSVDNNEAGSVNNSLVVILIVILIFMYFIGVYLHTKIIQTSKRDKTLTWKLDIVNSISVLFHFPIAIIMFIVTYLKLDLKSDICSYIGPWICYVIKIIIFMGRNYIVSHSLIICLMKYCIIVFHDKVREVGKHMVETIFVWMDVLYPIFIYVLFNVTKKDNNFIANLYQEQYYYPRKQGMILDVNTNKTVSKLFNACKYEPFEQISFHYIFNISKTTLCWISAISILLNSLNILEAFLYFKTFRFMNR